MRFPFWGTLQGGPLPKTDQQSKALPSGKSHNAVGKGSPGYLWKQNWLVVTHDSMWDQEPLFQAGRVFYSKVERGEGRRFRDQSENANTALCVEQERGKWSQTTEHGCHVHTLMECKIYMNHMTVFKQSRTQCCSGKC